MKIRNNEGFTLVEIIISLAIVSIISVVFLNIIHTGIASRNISRERLQALALSTSILDEIKTTQTTWENINGLKTWLNNQNFDQIDSVFIKSITDSNNISYNTQIILDELIDIDDLFEVRIMIESPNVKQINVITRLRVGK